MGETKVVRVGKEQYDKLKALSDSHNVSMAQMLSMLVDKMEKIDITVRPAEIEMDVIIDKGFRAIVTQYPTLAEVERRNQSGSKKQ